MENNEDLDNYYSSLERLHATPHNFYASQILVPVAAPSINAIFKPARNNYCYYWKWKHGKPRAFMTQQKKKKGEKNWQVGKFNFNMIDTCGYQIFQCFQVYRITKFKICQHFWQSETNLVSILCTVPSLLKPVCSTIKHSYLANPTRSFCPITVRPLVLKYSTKLP